MGRCNEDGSGEEGVGGWQGRESKQGYWRGDGER